MKKLKERCTIIVEIKIKEKKIGDDHPCFLIAEIGVNHNGNFYEACKMIETLEKVGVDAVKFQTYITEELVLKSEKLFSMLKKYELSLKDWDYLAKYVTAKNMIFLSTPFDVKSVETIKKLVPAFKISSGDLNNFHLLKRVCSIGKPVFISTGIAVEKEVKMAVDFLKENGVKDIVIFQCTTQYPVFDNDVNLNVIDLYKKMFPDCVIGFSDHSVGITASLGAVAKGAKIIERHFTLDKKAEGPDHAASLNLVEMKDWVKSIRKLETQLGFTSKFPSRHELKIRSQVRKSIVSIKDIKKGDVFSEKNISTKRPGFGVSAVHYYKIIGRKAKRDIFPESVIRWDDIELYKNVKNINKRVKK